MTFRAVFASLQGFLMFLLVESLLFSAWLVVDLFNVASGPLQLNCQFVIVNLGGSEVPMF